MPATRLIEALKPYLLLAVAAFLTGFLSYVGVGAAHQENSAAQAAPAPLVSAPVSNDWNLPKRI